MSAVSLSEIEIIRSLEMHIYMYIYYNYPLLTFKCRAQLFTCRL